MNTVAKINEISIDKDFPHEIIGYLDTASVFNGHVIEIDDLPLDEAPTRAKRIVRKNDILISTVRPNLKHFTYLKNVKENTIASTGFSVITTYDANPRFLYYYLTSNIFTMYLSQIAETHTSAYPSFNPDVIEEAEILIPPPDIQEKIANILGVFDDKIENNTKINQILEDIGHTIFKNWFLEYEFPNKDGESYKSNNGKFKKSKLGSIPEEWGVGDYSEVVENVRKSINVSKITEDMSYIGLEHMPKGSISLSDWSSSPEELMSNKFQFKKGQILYGKLRPYFKKVGIAPIDGICSTDILVLESKSQELFGFALFLTSSEKFTLYNEMVSIGTKMPRTDWDIMSIYPTIIPDSKTLKAFSKIIEPISSRINNNILEIHNLYKIRNTLIPKLLSGEVNIEKMEQKIA